MRSSFFLSISLALSLFLFGCGKIDSNFIPVISSSLGLDHDHEDAPWVHPTLHPDRIIQNMTEDPSSGFSVTWRTDTTSTRAMLQVALASANPGFTSDAETVEAKTELTKVYDADHGQLPVNYHSVTLTNLDSSSHYAYRVGNGKEWSEWFHTKTASKEDDPFTFLYVGDAQNGVHSHWSRVIRQAHLQAPDAKFIVHAGDLVDRGHRNSEWGEWYHAGGWIHSMIPSVAVPGNHEYQKTPDSEDRRALASYWRPQFTLPENGTADLPETNYYFEYQGVLFIGMDSNTGIERQATWLDEFLSTSNHKWRVMTFHHPIFSPSGDRDNDELRKAWKPIMDKYKIDLVLQGHDHTYARGHDLNASSGERLVDQQVGTVYVVSVSGAKMYDLKKSKWEQYGATMEKSAEDTQLYQVVTIDGDKLTFKAYTAVGDIYDAFTLSKNDVGPNVLTPILD